MAFWQLLAAIRRRPLITFAGLLVTLGVAAMVYQRPSVYFTEVNATLLNPVPPANRTPAAVRGRKTVVVNPLDGTNPRLVRTAGVVARILSQGAPTSLSGSDSISLVGQGVTHGYSITLPNSGGQWVFIFDRPVLDVQVVGRSPQEVKTLLDTAMSQIRITLRSREVQTGTSRDQYIRVLQSPQQPVINEGRGDRRRAGVVTLFLGLMLTLAAVQFFQDREGPIRRIVRFVRRRAGRGTAGAPPARAPDPVHSLHPVASPGRGTAGVR